MTKLTLSVDAQTVKQAKHLAQARGTSVSAMFASYIKSVAGPGRPGPAPGPITRRATGLARLPKGKTDRDVLGAALAEKYGIKA
ncbi:MAG: DUF6364 family protein [Tepidisphaeraceae bacterium]|jgi:hypothetical protein